MIEGDLCIENEWNLRRQCVNCGFHSPVVDLDLSKINVVCQNCGDYQWKLISGMLTYKGNWELMDIEKSVGFNNIKENKDVNTNKSE